LESPIAAIAKFCYFFLITGEQIRRHFEATQFVPFRVHMASGKSADVPHPDFMHLSRVRDGRGRI